MFLSRTFALFFCLLSTFALDFAYSAPRPEDTAQYDNAVLTIVNDSVVASEAPGVVKEITVRSGEDVDLETVLVALNESIYEAEMRAAAIREKIADLEARNDVNLRYAVKTLKVNQKLLSRSENARQAYAKSISQTDIDRLNLEVEQAALSAEQAELQADIATQQTRLESENQRIAAIKLNGRKIKAPFSGRIEQVFVQLGSWVNAGDPIARVIDRRHLRVKGIFDQKFLRRINVGSAATFTFDIGDETESVNGQVTFVGSEVKNRVFQVWMDIENTNMTLPPGIQGKFSIELN